MDQAPFSKVMYCVSTVRVPENLLLGPRRDFVYFLLW